MYTISDVLRSRRALLGNANVVGKKTQHLNHIGFVQREKLSEAKER